MPEKTSSKVSLLARRKLLERFLLCLPACRTIDFNTKKEPENLIIDEKEDYHTNKETNIELTDNEKDVNEDYDEKSEDE